MAAGVPIFHQVKDTGEPWELWQSMHARFLATAVLRFVQASGAEYPIEWTIEVPGQDLEIDLFPTVLNQELDTRQTTGVVYWEGSQNVQAMRAGEIVTGKSYIELTGYAPDN